MNVDFVALLKTGFLPGWGIFAILFAAYMRQRAANKSAENDAARVLQEAATNAEHVTAAQWSRFQGEINRLAERIKALEGKVGELEGDLERAHEREQAAIARAIHAEAENARLSAILMARGQMRQEAAQIVAVERVTAALERDRRVDEADGGSGDE